MRYTLSSPSTPDHRIGACYWLTGLSGAGKSTLATHVQAELAARGLRAIVLDGDRFRSGLNSDLGFSRAHRGENVRRIAEVARMLVDDGFIVLVSAIAPYRDDRLKARDLFAPGCFHEVYVDTDLQTCAGRDPKGLYAKARDGQLAHLTGWDDPYEVPQACELRLSTAGRSVPQAAEALLHRVLSHCGDGPAAAATPQAQVLPAEPQPGDSVNAFILQLALVPHRGLHLYQTLDEAPAFLGYAALHDRVRACMNQFAAQGVGRGTRVILPFETHAEVIVSFLALLGLGALTFSIKAVQGESDEEALAYVKAIADRHHVAHIVTRSARLASGGLAGLWPSADPGDHPQVPFAPEHAGDVAFVQFSSGSTSFPKGIPITRGALCRHLRMLNEHDDRQADDVYASWLPLYHDLGLILGLLTSLYRRNELHLASPMQFISNPTGWLRLLSDRRATHTATAYFAVSYALTHLERLDPDALQGLDFGALRHFLIGSDPTDFDRLMAFQARLAPHGFQRRALQPAYGLAEAVLVVSAVAAGAEPWAHQLEGDRRLVSVGPLLPGFEMRLTRADGSLCAEGEMGQIELRGGTLANGYFERPDLPFHNRDGYFETGDLAYVVRGELVIAGRMGDRIKVNGQNLFASDFEFAVESVPGIKKGRCAACQIGQRIIVLAELQKPSSESAMQCLRTAARDAVARKLGVKLPVQDICFIMPGLIRKTSSGKLRRRDMAQAFAEGRLQQAMPPYSPSGSVTLNRMQSVP